MPFHSPEAQALVERRDAERMQRWSGERPMFDTALTKGDFRLAEPGAEVWAKTDGDLADVRMNADGGPRGGIILEITTDPDVETGDLRRAFRCFDYTAPLWQAVTVLPEEKVDPHSFSAPDWSRIRRTYRRLCREVGKKLQGNHLASVDEIDMVRDAARLASILGQTLA